MTSSEIKVKYGSFKEIGGMIARVHRPVTETILRKNTLHWQDLAGRICRDSNDEQRNKVVLALLDEGAVAFVVPGRFNGCCVDVRAVGVVSRGLGDTTITDAWFREVAGYAAELNAEVFGLLGLEKDRRAAFRRGGRPRRIEGTWGGRLVVRVRAIARLVAEDALGPGSVTAIGEGARGQNKRTQATTPPIRPEEAALGPPL